jgi:hypothetical protein
MTGAFLLPRLLNPKNKNPPSLAGHSLALVRQVYYCPPLTLGAIFVVLKALFTVKEFTETAVPTFKPGTADDS